MGNEQAAMQTDVTPPANHAVHSGDRNTVGYPFCDITNGWIISSALIGQQGGGMTKQQVAVEGIVEHKARNGRDLVVWVPGAVSKTSPASSTNLLFLSYL